MFSKYRLILSLFTAMVLAAVIGGCAGSTRGTGGLTVTGKVLNQAGQPLSNVDVSILETGDTATTDEDGNYSIQTERRPDYSVMLEGESFTATAPISNVPQDTGEVTANFTVNEEEQTANEPEVIFEPEESGGSSSGSGSSNGSAGSGGDDSDDDDDTGSGGSGGSNSNNSGSSNGSGGSGGSGGEANEGSGGSGGSGGDDSSDDDDDDDDDDGAGGSGGDDSSDDDDGDSEEEESSCEEVDSEGSISSVNTSSITVSGTTYTITQNTEIEDENGDEISVGELSPGVSVRVRGECESDVLVAEEIRIED